MHTTVEETGKHVVRLSVEVTPDEVAQDLDRAYRKVAAEVKIPGFRKGKVPRKVIDARIGRDGHEIRDGQPFRFTATVEVRPRLTLEPDQYRGIQVEAPATEPRELEIDEYLDRLRERFAELDVVSRPAQKGDYVLADVRA